MTSLTVSQHYNIPLKAPPLLVCPQCLDTNTALGFPSCCISIHTHDSALNVILHFYMKSVYGVCAAYTLHIGSSQRCKYPRLHASLSAEPQDSIKRTTGKV